MPTSDDKTSPLAARLSALPEGFQHFTDIYDRELQPVLVERERDRQAAIAEAKKFGIIGVVVAVLMALGAVFLLKAPMAIFFALIVGAGFIYFGVSKVQTVMGHAKQAMIPPVAAQFGLTYNEAVSDVAEANLLACKTHKMVPSWDRKSLQDEFIGSRNGVPFEFFEAHLEERRTTTDSKGRTRTSWVTVFRGQCWVIDAPKRFHGTTRVARDAGIFNALGGLGSKFTRAVLESPDFEKIFEVYTTDQVEARFLLTPDVMQAFIDLETTFKGSKFRATFDGNRIYAALEGGNMFEPGSMFKSLDDSERVADLLDDIATVFHLVDVLGK